MHVDELIRRLEASSIAVESKNRLPWSYTQSFDHGLDLLTYVRYRHPVLYFHHVRQNGQMLQMDVSLLAWLGVSSQTTWDLALPDDVAVKDPLIRVLNRSGPYCRSSPVFECRLRESKPSCQRFASW